MKNLVLKLGILIPLLPIILIVGSIFIISYIDYLIMIFKIYSQLF